MYENALNILTYLVKVKAPIAQKNEICYRLAMIFSKARFFDQAINHFNMAIYEESKGISSDKYIDILVKLATCYIEKEDYESASHFCQVALIKNKENPNILLQAAWCEFLLGQYPIALEYAGQAISLEEKRGVGYYIRGRIFLAVEKLAEAKASFEKALVYDESNVIYLTSLGITNAMRKLYQESLNNFIKAIKINSSTSEIWYNLGLLYESLQQYSLALAAYKESVNIDQSFYPARMSRDSLCNEYFLQFSNSRFVHLKFYLLDSMTPDHALVKDFKVRKLCENYFKTLPSSHIGDSDNLSKPPGEQLPILQMNLFNKSPAKDSPLRKINKEQMQPQVPNASQINSQPLDKKSYTKSNNQIEQNHIELVENKDFHAPEPKSTTSKANLKSSHAPQDLLKAAQLQPPTPIEKTPSMEDTQVEALFQLLKTQREQVQNIMIANGHFPQAKSFPMPISTQISENPIIAQPLALRCALDAKGVPCLTAPMVGRNNIFLNQPNIEESNNLKWKDFRIDSTEQQPELKEDDKEEVHSLEEKKKDQNNSVTQKQSTKHKKNRNTNTIVRLNMPPQKINNKKRRRPETDKNQLTNKECKTKHKKEDNNN